MRELYLNGILLNSIISSISDYNKWKLFLDNNKTSNNSSNNLIIIINNTSIRQFH